jgi:hypothetical protein
VSWNVLQPTFRLEEEVVMITDIGIEVGPAWFDDELAKKTLRGELMQGVVNCRQRQVDLRRLGLAMELLSRHVAIPGLK